ncbi:glycoside hydrolase family 30 beta sandwich domain-containing protein [Reichenbachiella ulvae]|uniref:Glycosyl hydrolase family 30 beta sandwich domain-containing protein n=1 Tax=Reichenbachiella ulvae TaxID=2980104 RepID=A0ABT3CXW9_9BACT|nr:glycoside hydrolase family 30 beta sandwich domain-containing protein [Reichenbachiella ulvae]MCV9388426.1 hypothetical protein [Reichenbachiella ulvae]
MKDKLLKKGRVTLMLASLLLLGACGGDDEVSKPDDNTGTPIETPEETVEISIDPSNQHQEMIGFGGALTWYCDRITSSSKKNEIIDLMVNDLGMDMVRLKNWYYPVDYPNNKVPDQMETSWFINHFTATDELYDLVKAANPDVKVLLSSWGPPSALKSNGSLNRGTLKQEAGEFMYDAFAEYTIDMLDNISFMPDYLSIQNEPTWLADWETCEWAPSETSSLPGYDVAFEEVSKLLDARDSKPIMLGPESANLSSGAFDDFAEVLSNHPSLGAYGFHPYNFNNSSSISDMQSTLASLGTNFSDKPKIMTEYDGLDWIKTAQFININVREGNVSAYLYWTLMWAEDSDLAMFQVQSNGNYTLTPFYHLMKHYAKYVDGGYKRIEVDMDETLDQVAFLNPEGTAITLVVVNANTSAVNRDLEITGNEIATAEMYYSLEDEHFVSVDVDLTQELEFKGESISTLVLTLK